MKILTYHLRLDSDWFATPLGTSRRGFGKLHPEGGREQKGNVQVNAFLCFVLDTCKKTTDKRNTIPWNGQQKNGKATRLGQDAGHYARTISGISPPRTHPEVRKFEPQPWKRLRIGGYLERRWSPNGKLLATEYGHQSLKVPVKSERKDNIQNWSGMKILETTKTRILS